MRLLNERQIGEAILFFHQLDFIAANRSHDLEVNAEQVKVWKCECSYKGKEDHYEMVNSSGSWVFTHVAEGDDGMMWSFFISERQNVLE